MSQAALRRLQPSIQSLTMPLLPPLPTPAAVLCAALGFGQSIFLLMRETWSSIAKKKNKNWRGGWSATVFMILRRRRKRMVHVDDADGTSEGKVGKMKTHNCGWELFQYFLSKQSHVYKFLFSLVSQIKTGCPLVLVNFHLYR